MIHVVNKKDWKNDGTGVYIGRPSVLSNPYRIGPDGNRFEVIEKYKNRLRRLSKTGPVWSEIRSLKQQYKEKGELTLVCFCKPLPCHGDVLKEAILGNIKAKDLNEEKKAPTPIKNWKEAREKRRNK